MADPTPYDILQDNQISALQDIVTPYYQPPGESEYSFPIVGQGISSDQYRQTNLGTGNGILHRFPETYYLDTHATAAETNQRNSLILKVTRNNEPGAVAEAIINGFFHRMTEDIEIPMPPVLSPTDVFVTLTYDPREEESETGPISVQTHNGSLPTTHGREHILIGWVEMLPNQLLSATPIRRQRQYSSPVVYVPTATTIPSSDDFLYGTTLIMGTNGRGRIMHNSSTQENWVDLLTTDWEDCTLRHGWENHGTFGPVQSRIHQGKVEMRGTMRNGTFFSSNTVVQLPPGHTPSRSSLPLNTHFIDRKVPMYVYEHGGIRFAGEAQSVQWVSFEGVSFSL